MPCKMRRTGVYGRRCAEYVDRMLKRQGAIKNQLIFYSPFFVFFFKANITFILHLIANY